jgi:hypothetical protein
MDVVEVDDLVGLVRCSILLVNQTNLLGLIEMTPIELDDYGLPATFTSTSTGGQADQDQDRDPLLPSSSSSSTVPHPRRHARFADPQPGDPHYYRGRSDHNNEEDEEDDEFHNVPDHDPSTGWRASSSVANRQQGRCQRNRSSSNPTSSFFPRRNSNTRKFPLLLVGLIGVPVLLLSLIYGIIRGNAPDLLPDLHLPGIIYGGQTDDSVSLAERCICGAGAGASGRGGEEGKGRTEGERICQVYGKEALIWSRLHEGTGNRLKSFIKRAKTGKKLKLGILGGSGESPLPL